MADLLLQDDDQDPSKPKADAASGGGPLVGGSSAEVGAGPAGSAGVGKGGTGGYTNIQAYLGANQGDTGSAQNLQKTAAPTFDNESNTMKTQANDYVSGAQKQLDDNKVDNTKADSLIKDAAGQYSYGDHQNDAYSQSVNKVQGALNNQYSGPTSYNYALGADAQNLGTQLKDQGGFDTLMSGVYGKAAGKDLSQGQYQLQKQFDVNNSALQDTRNALTNQYSGLEKQRDDTVADTTTKLGGLADQYRTNQSALKDYLYGQANNFDTAETKAENAATASFGQDMTTDKSGLGSIGMSWLNGLQGSGGGATATRQNLGILGDNLNWDQIQKEQDAKNYAYSSTMHGLYTGYDPVGWDARAGRLNDYYGAENAKYAGAGDNEKKSYNAIQDFLGTAAARKQQGFKVKG